jgi:predicted transcriptional regulator
MKAVERERARKLRSVHGASVGAIANELGVSRSSVSRWTRDIVLTPGQETALRRENSAHDRQEAGREATRRAARERRRKAQEHGRMLSREGDQLHAAGCMLYWAEGSNDRNTVVLTNSDADLVAYFLRFLRSYYAIPDERISLSINCHLSNGLELHEIERWWLDRLQLPPASLRSPTLNRYSTASLRKRRTLPYGTARVVVCSTFVVQSIYGGIQEYAGLSRDDWLD